MQQTQTEYSIVKGAAGNEELENYRLCFERNGTDRDMSNLEWLHHKNLLNTNVIYYAIKAGFIAGIYTALPVIFKINDKLLPGLQSIDTLTDMDHRGKGLFLKLANKLNMDAPANGFALIYGFPNDNSATGFFRKLKWTSFGEAPFLIKPLSTYYFLKKLLIRKKHTDFSSSNYIFEAPQAKQLGQDCIIKVIRNFDKDYDRLWKLTSENIKVCVDRGSTYMNWRYVIKPGEHYYRYGFYKNDKLAGAIVFSIKN
ncbi:MAG: GNAT family N-acetyltransferase, partial [Ferruginibacter sp.]